MNTTLELLILKQCFNFYLQEPRDLKHGKICYIKHIFRSAYYVRITPWQQSPFQSCTWRELKIITWKGTVELCEQFTNRSNWSTYDNHAYWIAHQQTDFSTTIINQHCHWIVRTWIMQSMWVEVTKFMLFFDKECYVWQNTLQITKDNIRQKIIMVNKFFSCFDF